LVRECQRPLTGESIESTSQNHRATSPAVLSTRPGLCLPELRNFYFAALSAIRDLTAAIHSHNERVSELHEDIRKIEGSVGYLQRAERHERERNMQKVNV
jgi:hypothetical protein